MRVENLDRLDAGLLDQLGVASAAYSHTELDRLHVAQLRRGSGISYLVARDDAGTPLGMVPVYTAAPPWDPIVDPAAVVEPPVPVSGPRLCLAGSPGVYENHLRIAPSLHGPDGARVAGTLLEHARALGREAGCHQLLVGYLNRTQSRWLAGYHDQATAVGLREKAVLPVAWESFEDYLSWLPSKKRRNVRRERRAFQRSGIDVREARLAEVSADLAPLLTQTENRHGRGVRTEQMEFYLLMLGMHLDGDCDTLVAYRHGRAIAFSLALRDGDRWIMRSWGCDYASLNGEGLYFNLVYYEPIERAIERGIGLIDFGVGALEAKTLRGCGLERLQTILLGCAPPPPRPPPRQGVPRDP